MKKLVLTAHFLHVPKQADKWWSYQLKIVHETFSELSNVIAIRIYTTEPLDINIPVRRIEYRQIATQELYVHIEADRSVRSIHTLDLRRLVRWHISWIMRGKSNDQTRLFSIISMHC